MLGVEEERVAVAELKKLKSTGSCCWISWQTAWRMDWSHLQRTEEIQSRGREIQDEWDSYLTHVHHKFTSYKFLTWIWDAITFEHLFFCIFQLRGRCGAPGGKPTWYPGAVFQTWVIHPSKADRTHTEHANKQKMNFDHVSFLLSVCCWYVIYNSITQPPWASCTGKLDWIVKR